MKHFNECLYCGKHRAVFTRRDKRVRKDRKHDVCLRCYRSLRSAFMAQNLMSRWS
jgi:hypothetical protein